MALNRPCPFSTSPPSQMDCAERPCAPSKAAMVKTRAAPFKSRARSVFVCRMSIEYPLNLNAKIRRITGPSPKRHRNVTNNGHLESFRGFEAHFGHLRRLLKFTQVGPNSTIGSGDADIFGHHEHPSLNWLMPVVLGGRRCPSPCDFRPSRLHPDRRRNLVERTVPRGPRHTAKIPGKRPGNP